LRFIQTLTGRGDELVLAQQWFAAPSRLVVAALVLLIGAPPLVAAFRALANRRRIVVFLVSLLLPLPLLFVLLVGNEFLFGANGHGWQLGSVLGISLLVLITDLVAAALFLGLAPRYLHTEAEA
ncbi:MAG TPA: hypothetical protein PKE45_26155, partial [Caldilineaceae bacterium]|nr:hypothetical protein [Caldilineaceae bacterium]